MKKSLQVSCLLMSFVSASLLSGATDAPVAAPAVAPSTIFANTKTARAKMFISSGLSVPLETYRMDTGHYPSTADGLQALFAAPAGDTERWRGPYLKDDKAKVLTDPWGNPYQYRCPGVHNPDGYDVWSRGPDGKDGTDDDICNWVAASSQENKPSSDDNYKGQGPREKDIMQCTVADPDTPIKLVDLLPTVLGIPLTVKSIEIVKRGDASTVARHNSIPAGTKVYPVIFRIKFNVEEKIKAKLSENGNKPFDDDTMKSLQLTLFMYEKTGVPFEGYFFQDSYGSWMFAPYAELGRGDASPAGLEEIEKTHSKWRAFAKEIGLTTGQP